MGLLDFMGESPDDPRFQATGLLAQALLGARKGGGMQALSQGLLGYNGAMSSAKDQALKRQMLEAQIAETKAQEQQRAQQAAAAQAAAQREAQFRGSLAPQVNPAQAMAGGGGPTMANAANIPQQQAVDWRALAMQYPDKIELIQKLAQSSDLGKSKVARTVETKDANGRPITIQLDEFGRPVGEGMAQWKAPEFMDLGGKRIAVDPTAVQPGQSWGKTMTPGEVASNGLGWANHGLAKEAAARAAAKENAPNLQFNAELGTTFNPRTGQVMPAIGPDGKNMTPKNPAATEDERKASGWVSQAENAWKNMAAVAFGDGGALKKAARPGVIESLPGVMEGIKNYSRSEERQKFVQAGSSLSESLLRAATGAGVNKDEAEQKVREITPQVGDSDALIKQKMDAIPIYLQSLRQRAGRALPNGMPPVRSVPGANDGWFAEEVK